MRHASLFSGIGGFDLAAKWAGWENVLQVESDPFCQQVLKHHFPEAELHHDIQETSFRHLSVDIVSAGFPCPPFSVAGKRKGTEDERYLWHDVDRAICELQPTFVVGENVRGLLNWGDGRAFEEVCTSLEGQGYEVIPFVLPASGVGAPHRRERAFIVAHAQELGQERTGSARPGREGPENGTTGYHAPHTSSKGREGDQQPPSLTQRQGESTPGPAPQPDESDPWKGFPHQSPLCEGDDGLPSELDPDTLPGKNSYAKWRRESIKAYGNAVVPQVAYRIFRAIDQNIP
jgi:DNA (cytosine-5)-methyltransferase 1